MPRPTTASLQRELEAAEIQIRELKAEVARLKETLERIRKRQRTRGG